MRTTVEHTSCFGVGWRTGSLCLWLRSGDRRCGRWGAWAHVMFELSSMRVQLSLAPLSNVLDFSAGSRWETPWSSSSIGILDHNLGGWLYVSRTGVARERSRSNWGQPQASYELGGQVSSVCEVSKSTWKMLEDGAKGVLFMSSGAWLNKESLLVVTILLPKR